MATITKLGQTFVARTEATAASLNIQNAKIDELIDIFGKETTGNTKTIAIPFTKGSSTVKVTTLGTGLSVSDNTLSATTTYTLPAATTSSLGGVKVGDGLSIGTSGSTAGVLKIEYDSTLKTTGGVLGVANPGGMISSNLMYFTKANANDYLIAGATVQTTTFTNNVANINISNSHKTLVLLLPTDKDSFTLRDSGSQDITGDLLFISPIVRNGKLYNMFYFSGSTVADNYTLTKND